MYILRPTPEYMWLRVRAGYTTIPLLNVFSPDFFCKRCLSAPSNTVSSKTERYEQRLTENRTSPEPNMLSLCSISRKKAYIDPNIFLTEGGSRKSTGTPYWVCISQSCACILIILQPLAGKLRCVRSSCFTVRYRLASVGMWVVGIVAEVQPQMSVARELVLYVFQVGGVLFAAFVSEAVFGLRNASNWSVSSPKKIAVNVSFLRR